MSTLDEKINEIEKKMPGIGDRLKPYSRMSGYYHSQVSDVAFTETDNYHVVLARWHNENDRSGPGIAWKEAVTCYFARKDDGVLNGRTLEMVTTRSAYDPAYDLEKLWGCDKIEIVSQEKDTVGYAWSNGKERFKFTIEYEYGLNPKDRYTKECLEENGITVKDECVAVVNIPELRIRREDEDVFQEEYTTEYVTEDARRSWHFYKNRPRNRFNTRIVKDEDGNPIPQVYD